LGAAKAFSNGYRTCNESLRNLRDIEVTSRQRKSSAAVLLDISTKREGRPRLVRQLLRSGK
jgi:hypothetical protein